MYNQILHVMKKLLLFAAAGAFTIGAMAQTSSETASGLNAAQKAKIMNADLGIPSNPNTSIVYRGTAIGNLPNAYAYAFGPRTFLTYNELTNVIATTHRSDAVNNGDAGSGSLRYDYSTDGGMNWTSDVVLFDVSISRYPQSQLLNPAGNTNAANIVHATIAPALTGSNGENWGGYTMLLTNPGGTVVTDSVEETPGDGHYNLISNSMCTDADGNLHHIDLSINQDTSLGALDYVDTLVYRRSSDFKNGSMAYTIDLLYAPVFDDTAGNGKTIVDACIAFHPTNADIGYISCLAYSSSGGTPFGYYVPMMMKTMDGGDTWSAPEFLDISNMTGVQGTLDSATSSDILTTAFESDLTVDANGDAHLIVDIGRGTGAWSISSGPGFFGCFDIMYDGSTAEGHLIAQPGTFRGEFVSDLPGGNIISEDNRPQLARSPGGSWIFAVYFDTDTLISEDNLFPDAYMRAYKVVDGAWSDLINMTKGTSDDALMTWGNVSDVAIPSPMGEYYIPMTRLDATDDILESKQMYYVSYEFVIGGVEEAEISGLNIYPNPATDVLNVELDNSGEFVVNIYNTVGQLVDVVEGNGNHVSVNTSSLSSGLYFAEVKTASARSTKQFMVK